VCVCVCVCVCACVRACVCVFVCVCDLHIYIPARPATNRVSLCLSVCLPVCDIHPIYTHTHTSPRALRPIACMHPAHASTAASTRTLSILVVPVNTTARIALVVGDSVLAPLLALRHHRLLLLRQGARGHRPVGGRVLLALRRGKALCLCVHMQSSPGIHRRQNMAGQATALGPPAGVARSKGLARAGGVCCAPSSAAAYTSHGRTRPRAASRSDRVRPRLTHCTAMPPAVCGCSPCRQRQAKPPPQPRSVRLPRSGTKHRNPARRGRRAAGDRTGGWDLHENVVERRQEVALLLLHGGGCAAQHAPRRLHCCRFLLNFPGTSLPWRSTGRPRRTMR
jgi:hypothetical protein